MSHNKLAEMRKRAGLTQQQLAEKIGVTQQTIWYYENDKREMKSGVLISMSQALGCTVADLLGISSDRGILDAVPTQTKLLPVFGRIAAGTAREVLSQSDMTHETPGELLKSHPESFWLIVSGNSMNRMFPDGSLVLIDPAEEVRNGDVAAIFVNGDDATIKRVYFENTAIRLHPESYDPEYRDRVINSDDPDAPAVRIIGKAVSYTAPTNWRP